MSYPLGEAQDPVSKGWVGLGMTGELSSTLRGSLEIIFIKDAQIRICA